MTAPDLFFWVCAAVLVASSVFVVSARSLVHAVFFLILAFLNAAGLFILLGAEFLGMMMLIVYVGAVAVLFLFVVMTLDAGTPAGSLRARLPAALAAGVILLLELAIVVTAGVPAGAPVPLPGGVSNTRALGRLIYTDYAALFELAGAILLSAMIGAIVLAHRRRPGVRRQDPGRQSARHRSESVRLEDPAVGAGVSEQGR